jgi:hypothetical protein
MKPIIRPPLAGLLTVTGIAAIIANQYGLLALPTIPEQFTTTTDGVTRPGWLLTQSLAINLTFATVLIYGIFHRRHHRNDLAVAYLAFNLSLFTVAAALATSPTLSIGLGFGLFAVLSIVRLRSDEARWSEIGYTMVTLVLGLVNGLPGLLASEKILFSAILTVGLHLGDHPRWHSTPTRRHRVELEQIIADPHQLTALLTERLDATVIDATIRQIDYVRDTMTVDVHVKHDATLLSDGTPHAPADSTDAADLPGGSAP